MGTYRCRLLSFFVCFCVYGVLVELVRGIEWSGAVDQDWNNDANWTGGSQPLSFDPVTGDDVEINIGSGGNFPVVSTAGEFARDVVLGQGDEGQLEVQAGGTLSARSLMMADGAGTFATITVSGGSIDTSSRGDVVIGQTGDAELLMSGGTLSTENLAVALDDGSGSVELSAGLIQIGQDCLIAMDQYAYGSVDQSGGTIRIGGDLLLTGTSSDAYAVYFLGGGTLDLTGGDVLFNSGVADFTFFGGRLEDVVVFGATLDNDGGTLAPGDSIGLMTIQGDYNQNGGIYEVEVDGVTQVADRLDVQGTAALGGELQIVASSQFSTSGDYSKTILEASTEVMGTFVDVPDTVSTTSGGGPEHVGHGNFLQALHYTSTAVTIDLFQALSGDSDGDRDVDITDFNGLAVHFDPLGNNASSNDWFFGDFDIDGDVDITDFNALALHFSPLGYVSTGPKHVPEPQNWMLLIWGAAALAVSWRATRCP